MNFERFIIINNPASTNAKRLNQRIAEIKSVCPQAEIVIINTSPKGRDADSHILEKCADKLGKKVVLCIAAGDGTVNNIVQQLLTDSNLPNEARRTPVLPLWCGNANDLAAMLNGPARKAHLGNVLQNGSVVEISPLKCQLTDAGGTTHYYHAVCYASFGASAFVAGVLARFVRRNNPLHKLPGGRFLQELAVVARALMQAPRFAVRDSDGVKDIYERTFLKGSRFAKIGGVPQLLVEDSFYAVTVEQKRLVSLMYRISEMARRSRKPKFATKHSKFTVLEDAWAQFDGETVKVSAGTKVELGLSDRHFYALSTQLRNTKQPGR